MELTKEEKQVARAGYSGCETGPDMHRVYAAVSAVLEMRGHEALRDDVSKDEQIAVLSSAFHDVLCDFHTDDATFQETKERYLAEALAENKMIESLLPMFMEIAGMPALTPAAPETPTEPNDDDGPDLEDLIRGGTNAPSARQSATMDDEVRHTPGTEPCPYTEAEMNIAFEATRAEMPPYKVLPADGRLVEQMIDACLKAQGYTKAGLKKRTKADEGHALLGMTAAMQLCLSSRNLVALPDVERAITEVLEESVLLGVMDSRMAGTVLKMFHKRLKPEPARQEPMPLERVEAILNRIPWSVAAARSQKEVAAEIVEELSEKGRAE